MAAAADGNFQSPIPGESQRGEDVGRTGATGDEGGLSADRPVPDRADLFVAFIERAEQPSGEVRSELLYVGVVDEVRVGSHAYDDCDSSKSSGSSTDAGKSVAGDGFWAVP
jgi:hypothetical protein